MWIRSPLFSVAIVAGLFLWGARALFAQPANVFNQLVEKSRAEMAQKGGKLTVATNWVRGQGEAILETFKNDFPFIKQTRFEVLRGLDTSQRILVEYKSGRPVGNDITSVPAELWPEFQAAGAFVKPSFSYRELAKSLPAEWPRLDPRLIDPEEYFVSISAGVRGIAYNKNLVPPEKAPKRWEDCLDPMWKGKVLYDSRPTLHAFQHDPKTREWHLKWLKGMVENQPVLMRARAQSMEKIAGGELPLYCGANYSHAMPMIEEGAPAVFFLPDPFPVDITVMIHVTPWSTPATTQLFAAWAATKGQLIMEEKAYRGFPWIAGTRINRMAQGKQVVICDMACQRKSADYFVEHGRILGLPGQR